ncbi:hypothetical protein LSAT2_006242 [Lamellibrachia satsuma]|nr:hypothetical protein LSAT2_006242 [Lamellibrachia satsuma]
MHASSWGFGKSPTGQTPKSCKMSSESAMKTDSSVKLNPPMTPIVIGVAARSKKSGAGVKYCTLTTMMQSRQVQRLALGVVMVLFAASAAVLRVARSRGSTNHARKNGGRTAKDCGLEKLVARSAARRARCDTYGVSSDAIYTSVRS